MNYKRIYNEIIDNRIANSYVGYTERHHIIPKSLGGSNKKNNLVDLSAREHFICHYLLVKIHKGSNKHKMAKAFNMMNNKTSTQERYINSLLYESQREAFSKAQSVCQSGSGNSQHGKVWITDGVESSKILKDGKIPDGWYKGRVIGYNTPRAPKTQEELEIIHKNKEILLRKKARKKIFKRIRKIVKTLQNLKRKKAKITELSGYYEIYRTQGFEEFVEITKYPYSKANLVMSFDRYVEQFVPQNGKQRK